MKITNKTWNEFWGEFLLVTFHKDHPDKWEPVRNKAKWVWDNAGLDKSQKLLDLGCGSGMLDICLAEMGAEITAIDRIEPVIKIAQNESQNLPVKFIHGDLKQTVYPENSFDRVLILETIGLMNKHDDYELIENSFRWLVKGGKIIIDSPDPEQVSDNFWTRDFPEGVLEFKTVYDPSESILTITPALKVSGNEEIRLYDPYSTDKGEYTGVKRYLYSRSELKKILNDVGYKAEEITHYWGSKYYALAGIKD